MRGLTFAGKRGLAVALGVLVASPAQAAVPPRDLPETVTIDDALRLLKARGPRIAAEHARVDVAAADIIAARALPNPSLSYSGLRLIEGQSTGAVTQHQVGLEQPLLLFSQRRIRGEVAELGVNTARARESLSYADRARDVRQAFAVLLVRQEKERLLVEARQDLDRVEHIVAGRVGAGDKSRYDLLRIQVENGSLAVQLANAHTDVDDASGQLALLLGFPGWRPRGSGSLQPIEMGTDLETLWRQARESRPSIVMSQRSEAAARRTVELARRERLPVPAVVGGAAFTKDVTGTSAFLGLSTPLPIFDRGQGPIARATAEANASALETEATTAEARADLERAVRILEQRRMTSETLKTAVLVRLADLRKMAEAAYHEGKGGILELLDAFRTLKDGQLSRFDQLLLVKLAEVDTLYAAGIIDTSN